MRPVPGYQGEELSTPLSACPPEEAVESKQVAPQSLFLQTRQTGSLQPLLGPALQLLPQLSRGGTSEYFHVLPQLRRPERHAAPKARPRRGSVQRTPPLLAGCRGLAHRRTRFVRPAAGPRCGLTLSNQHPRSLLQVCCEPFLSRFYCCPALLHPRAESSSWFC